MSDRLRRLSEYATVYMANARQLATYRLAREWMEAGVPAEQAAQWASSGYMPGEAAEHIAAERTPAEVAVIEAAEDAADSGETTAALREYALTEAAEAAAAGGLDELIQHRIKHLIDSGLIAPDAGDEPGIDRD